jgi:hypothetical protein
MLFCCPKKFICSQICKATSLLGTKITAKMPRGSLKSLFNIGKAKAAVLPEPVSLWTKNGKNLFGLEI